MARQANPRRASSSSTRPLITPASDFAAESFLAVDTARTVVDSVVFTGPPALPRSPIPSERRTIGARATLQTTKPIRPIRKGGCRNMKQHSSLADRLLSTPDRPVS